MEKTFVFEDAKSLRSQTESFIKELETKEQNDVKKPTIDLQTFADSIKVGAKDADTLYRQQCLEERETAKNQVLNEVTVDLIKKKIIWLLESKKKDIAASHETPTEIKIFLDVICYCKTYSDRYTIYINDLEKKISVHCNPSKKHTESDEFVRNVFYKHIKDILGNLQLNYEVYQTPDADYVRTAHFSTEEEEYADRYHCRYKITF